MLLKERKSWTKPEIEDRGDGWWERRKGSMQSQGQNWVKNLQELENFPWNPYEFLI